MRLLVVEDDVSLAKFLVQALSEAGYEPEHVLDGQVGLARALNGDHDLLLLDAVLPGISGFRICESVRRAGIRTPTIIISARGSVDDKVAGLDLGADDYLVKPFQITELLARMRAALRRRGSEDAVLRWGPIQMEPVERTVRVESREVALSPTEFGLLRCLLLHQGGTVSREAIMRTVWKQEFEGDDKVLDVYVSSLRRKLGKAGKLIMTERGVGYRMFLSGHAS